MRLISLDDVHDVTLHNNGGYGWVAEVRYYIHPKNFDREPRGIRRRDRDGVFDNSLETRTVHFPEFDPMVAEIVRRGNAS